MEQFLRTQLLIGKRNLRRLQKSSVTVIGLGAVGSYCVEALARAGVGAIEVIDFDTISRSNINRNLLASHSTVGKSKASIAARRIRDINPGCTVTARKLFVAAEVIDDLLKGKPDLVIDAIDSLNPKVQVLAAVKSRGIPLISSMGAACRTDPFVIRSADLFASSGCPLARCIRKRLRKMGISSGIPCVYSQEPAVKSALSLSAARKEGRALDRGRVRPAIGSLPTIPGIFGLVIAHLAMESLLGMPLSRCYNKAQR